MGESILVQTTDWYKRCDRKRHDQKRYAQKQDRKRYVPGAMVIDVRGRVKPSSAFALRVSMNLTDYPLIAQLDDPAQIRGYAPEKLRALADEARQFLIESIQKTGGHLGAALGVVELTLALFHEFDFLQDRIVWDVGHQAHVHKLLTGRAARFGSYGGWDGLCKFLERRESPYDHMGAGHASTSVAAALGMALARDLRHQKHHVLAVIGDGAMTGGLAYEALQNAGHLETDLIVILNDNGMSIDPNVGMFARTLTRITSSDPYNAFRDEFKRVSQKVPFGGELLKKSFKHAERSLKDYASPEHAAFFESLGFRYFGPLDGHNLRGLLPTLKHLRTMRGPLLLHLVTVKGKGLGHTVENTFDAHAVSAAPVSGSAPASVSPAVSVSAPASVSPAVSVSASPARSTVLVNGVAPVVPAAAVVKRSWTNIFSEGLDALMAADESVVALTAAMLSNTGLAKLSRKYPRRVLDLGIAEAAVYCSAAGLAIGGLKPFVTVYSTFSQRAFDQMVHDIALQRLPVRFMLDRGGFVGGDGPTHHGVFDHSYLRLIPGMVLMAPADAQELRQMLLTAHAYEEGPIAMRYPRGETAVRPFPADATLTPIPLGQAALCQDAQDPQLVLLAVGSMVAVAREAATTLMETAGLAVSVVNARFIKPLDERLLLREIGRAQGVLTLEESSICGGFGEGVLALLAREGVMRPVRVLGVPDAFMPFGSQAQQLDEAGLSVRRVVAAARDLWESISREPFKAGYSAVAAER